MLREVGDEALVGKLDAVALDAGEDDLECVAVGGDGVDVDGLARGLSAGGTAWAAEVQAVDAHDVGVLDAEEAGRRGRGRRRGGAAPGRSPARR